MKMLYLDGQVRIDVSATKRGLVALRLPDGFVLSLSPESAERLATMLANEAARARTKVAGIAEAGP